MPPGSLILRSAGQRWVLPPFNFNSADLGPFSAGGSSWALTFDRTGTYEYRCAIHGDLGMKGRVIVQPR